MVTIKHPELRRKYRARRKRDKSKWRFPIFFLKLIAFICPCLALPLLLIALPFAGLGMFLLAMSMTILEILRDWERERNGL